ncbi:MAG: hypothetical protein Pg6A_08910 [Termitinemataceae bacterium]|jgi:hypothetical protein|nr:MAG: hypothetical protein Pg6A_08910 [Termitinemataceae bacterium]
MRKIILILVAFIAIITLVRALDSSKYENQSIVLPAIDDVPR